MKQPKEKIERRKVNFNLTEKTAQRLDSAEAKFGHGIKTKIAEIGISGTLDEVERRGPGILYEDRQC